MGIESPVHLLFIAIVALIFLGPKRLPGLARALGQGIREFRSSIEAGADEPVEPPAPAAPPHQAAPAAEPRAATTPASPVPEVAEVAKVADVGEPASAQSSVPERPRESA
jgi:sec-independent protein translocase protein TatA